MHKQFIISIAIIIFTLSFVAQAPAQKRDLSQLPIEIYKEIKFQGKTLCFLTDSRQCEFRVTCDNNRTTIKHDKTLEGLLKVEYVKISIEGQACATFDIDIKDSKNPCRCSGGRCYCWSDRRLKRNIHKIGQLENGLNVYTFNYIWDSALTVGVMADEVRKVKPEAVININGFDLVDYSKILK